MLNSDVCYSLKNKKIKSKSKGSLEFRDLIVFFRWKQCWCHSLSLVDGNKGTYMVIWLLFSFFLLSFYVICFALHLFLSLSNHWCDDNSNNNFSYMNFLSPWFYIWNPLSLIFPIALFFYCFQHLRCLIYEYFSNIKISDELLTSDIGRPWGK
jgi:hypothetical protein